MIGFKIHIYAEPHSLERWWPTFIVSTGDALDVLTNNIEFAFVRGKSIDLDNHQKQLYRKFRDKYAEEKE